MANMQPPGGTSFIYKSSDGGGLLWDAPRIGTDPQTGVKGIVMNIHEIHPNFMNQLVKKYPPFPKLIPSQGFEGVPAPNYTFPPAQFVPSASTNSQHTPFPSLTNMQHASAPFPSLTNSHHAPFPPPTLTNLQQTMATPTPRLRHSKKSDHRNKQKATIAQELSKEALKTVPSLSLSLPPPPNQMANANKKQKTKKGGWQIIYQIVHTSQGFYRQR